VQPRLNDFSRAGLIFLWLLSLHQGKESNKQAFTSNDMNVKPGWKTIVSKSAVELRSSHIKKAS
jgi:hypothetical protein